jgi:predicted phosphodiesterase
MKIGLFSDVHGNLAALEAVLAALRQAGCQRLLCAGDVVGYGPEPSACIARVRETKARVVKGNHDDWSSNSMMIPGAASAAAWSLYWTRSRITPEEREWLSKLPLVDHYGPVDITHASCDAIYPAWPYVRDLVQLERHFAKQTQPMALAGHTHRPYLGLRLPTGELSLTPGEGTMTWPAGSRVYLNPGAVGQPRDGNPLAAYAILEMNLRQIHFARVPYEIERTIAGMRAENFPASLSERLLKGE